MGGDERRLTVALSVLLAFLVAEVTAGYVAGSLALLGDAVHLLIDVLAMGAAVAAARLARRPAEGKWTFGLARAEILSAAASGAMLAVLGVVVLVEAIRRIVHPPPVSGLTVVVVAAAGLVVNALAATVLHGADRHSLNVRGAIAHVATDAFGFAATLIAGVVVLTTGWRRADPAASIVIVALLLRSASRLLRDSGRVLLEAAPRDVDLIEVRTHLLERPHVLDVHDLHVWTPTSRLPALSVHIVVDDVCFDSQRAPQLLDELQQCLVGHFDVEHSTFQLEAAGHLDHEAGAHR
jgi:cobalt-zinc-cadmium efflux system protein